MRLIVSNADARELHALMTANPDTAPEIAFRAGHRNAAVIFAGRKFPATARRTPSARGSLVIEDFDGRIIAEGVADDEGESS